MVSSMGVRESRVVLNNQWPEWLKAAVVLAGMALLLWWYHHMRGRPYDLFSFNKSLAIAQVIGLCVGVALGPLCRFALGGERWIGLRRPICILAVMGLVAHGTIAFFFLPKQFPWKYYTGHAVSAILGLTSLTGLLALWVISYPAAHRRLGARGWKWLQLLVYPLLAAGVTHFTMLDKFPNWAKWFRTLEPALPPGTMLPFALACLLGIIKLLDVMRHGQIVPIAADCDPQGAREPVELGGRRRA